MSLWQRLASNPGDESLWIMESIFFRAILPAGQGPNLGDNWSQVKLIKERLRRWQAGECGQLWAEAKAGQGMKRTQGKKKKGVEKEQPSLEERNAQRCKTKAQ